MKQHPDAPLAPRLRATTTEWIAFLLLGFPLATALAAMLKTAVNIPLEDDYTSVARFVDGYVQQSGFLARIGFILTYQFTQYKLILLNVLTALQYQLVGHTDYVGLQLLGDLSVPAVLLPLWLILARQQRPFRQAIWLILPPWCLFVSLCYYEAVNMVTTEFFLLGIAPFAFASVSLFTSPVRHAALWGTFFLILSIASNPSGLFLAAALSILLIYQCRLRVSLVVVLTAFGMAALYSVHYKVITAHDQLSHHVRELFVFPFAFLGGILPTIPAATLLGLVLVAGFILLLTRGWARVSPDTFCIALFCLFTAVALAPARIHEGVQSALASRYKMFPLMFLSAEYLAVLRIFVPHHLRLRSAWSVAIGLATLVTTAFAISSQMHAYRMLHARQRLLTTHLILWERHPERLVAVPDEPGFYYGSVYIPARTATQKTLAHDVASGLYIPPFSAYDPLPVKPHSAATLGIEDEPPPARN